MDQAIETRRFDMAEPALTALHDGRLLAARVGLEMIKAQRFELGQRPNGLGPPVIRQRAQSRKMWLQRVPKVRRDQDWHTRRAGHLVRRTEYRCVADAVIVAGVEQVPYPSLDELHVVVSEGESQATRGVKPWMEPALLENAVPQPRKMFAVG